MGNGKGYRKQDWLWVKYYGSWVTVTWKFFMEAFCFCLWSFPQWKKKKEYGNPLVKVLQVPYQFLGFFPGDITLYVFQWVYRKFYRLPWKGGHVCSAGFMSKRHGKNQTNQPLEVKLKKNQRMKEESQRWCWSSLYCRTIFLVPASKEYLANQYSWASGEALLHQTFWFYYYLCCLLSVWPWASYLTSLCLYFLTYKMEIQV